MEGPVRIVITGATDAERACLQALVEECRFDSVRAQSEPLERAKTVMADGAGWDVLLCACPDAPAGLAAVLEAIAAGDRGASVVVMATGLSQEIALLAHRFGARVCLYDHGPGPLRLAILRAAEESAQRRRRTDDDDASERVQALVHRSVSDVVYHLRVEGERFRFVEINPAFTRATGLTEAQVVGKLVEDVIPEPSATLARSRYREAITEGRTVRWEETTEYPSGTKYGEVSITPVVDARGRCTRLVGTVQDVTEARERNETIRLYADIVRAVQTGLTVWNVPDAAGAGAITLAASNPAAAVLWGIDLAPCLGRPLGEILAARAAEELLGLVRAVAGDGVVRELHPPRAPGETRAFAVKAFPLPGARVGLAVEDATAQTRARALAAAEQAFLEMAASGRPLGETLEVLARAIEDEARASAASIQLVSADGARLFRGAASHVPEGVHHATDGAPVDAEAGPCSAAAALRCSVIVADPEVDPRWGAVREPARTCGLRACWAAPITAPNGRVLGTFALYHRTPRAPTPADLELIARAAHVAGIAIQRHELDEQLRRLSARIDAAREEERTGIAREIHDQLGQALTVLKMDLAWIARHASSAAGLSRDALLDKVAGLVQMTDETIREVRRISAELRPAVLDHVGLGAALVWKAHELEERAHLVCAVHSSLAEDAQLDRELSTAVYRVFQEALTNVVRHANATRVDVGLEESGGRLVLQVRDDGRGISQTEIDDPRSIGLLGIRERGRRLGGTVTFARAEPRGTVVTLSLPLRRGG